MRALHIFMLFMLITASGMSQEKNIETLSVSAENLIPFIIENYPNSNKDEASEIKRITFLLQTSSGKLSAEDAVIYKYAFRLLSERLSENDMISIVVYSELNGIVLDAISPKQIKKILYTIDNLKSSVKEFHADGIDRGYAYAKENFDEKAQNSVVMVRNPNAKATVQHIESLSEKIEPTKPKNHAILLTAISLLPEILTLIKD